MAKLKNMKKLCSLLLSCSVVLGNIAYVVSADETFSLPSESQLQDIVNDDFTNLSGKDDAEIRTALADMGYTVAGENTDFLTFSASEDKGLYMKRTGTSDELQLSRIISDGDGIAADDTLLPGHNMKGGGKYYVEYTFAYDQTAIYINGAGNWKNVFCRTQIGKPYPTELTVYGATEKYKLSSADMQMHVQTVVDTKDGNASGSTPQCVSNVFVNGEHVAVDADNKYVYNNASYYTTFLQTMSFILQRGTNAVDGGGLYLKNFRVSKIDEAAQKTESEMAEEDKNALVLNNTDAVTDDFTLPTSGSINGSEITWESSDDSIISISGENAVVTRPETDSEVTLTATVKYGEAEAVKEFIVTVKAEAKEQPAISEIGTNLALNKTVTGSGEVYSGTYGYGNITDGDVKTRMALKDWVNYKNAWIKIDLGDVYKLNQINIVEFRKRLKKFKLQYSVDDSTWEDIGEYSIDANNDAVDPFNHDPYTFDTVEGRYVRILIEENVVINNSQYLGISLYEVEVYYSGENVLCYDPNASAGEEGYMSSENVADYGITVPSTSWGSRVTNVNTSVDSVKNKKGIMFSPRKADDSVLRETGRMVFANDTVNNPKAINNTENGYVFEQEFLSYIRPNLAGDALWQYRLMGKGSDGNEAVIANLETKLTKTASGLPTAQNGIVYGEAYIKDADRSNVLPFPAQAGGSAQSPHISLFRVYVDLKNQTYTAWLVTRGDINTPYEEKESAREQLLVSDEPFTQEISEITGFQVWSQNTYGDQTHITRLSVKNLDAEQVVSSAAEDLTAEDILGENESAEKIITQLNLLKQYHGADVTWSISPSGILGTDGGIIAVPQQDTEVTLTAVIERDGKSASKQLKVTVLTSAVTESDERKVEIEKEALSLGDVSAVTQNMKLVTVGAERGCSISWSSDKPDIISADGTVNRPLRDEEVILTATISKGDASHTKTFTVTVKGTQEKRSIDGIEGSYFSGGDFYETNSMQFADLFEGDGSNGTNGTVAWTVDGKAEGLKAQKTADGIRYSRAGDGANPGRAQAILDKTYLLPEITDINKPYYLELNFAISAGGAINFDFGQNEGSSVDPIGNSDVVRVRKLDDYTGSDAVAGEIEGPAAYAFKLGDSIKAKAAYTSNENVSLGLYVIPSLKEMVFYKNGKPVSSSIYSYAKPESALQTLRVTWYQNIRWYNIPEAEYLTIKNFKVYQGPEIPADKRLSLDEANLTFASISSESEKRVTEDLNLIKTGKFGSSISWTSSNPEVVNPETGAVTRQTTSESVTLKATISYGGTSVEKVFELTVAQKGTDGNILTGAKVTIDGTSSIESLSNLTDGIFDTYIETMDKGIKPQITIDLGEDKIFSKVVIYEGMTSGAYNIKSGTVEVSSDKRTWTEVGKTGAIGANHAVSFIPVEARYIRFSVTGLDSDKTVRIYEIEAVMGASDVEIVQADMKDLKAFDSRSVKESTTFVTKGKFGSDISWESKDTSLVDNTGKVTRPTGSDKDVTIIATVSYGTKSSTVSFNHRILATGTSGGSSGGSGGGGGSSSKASGSGVLVTVNGNTPAPDKNDTKTEEKGFKDVSADRWSYKYIKSLYESGIMTGNEQGLFEPARAITREEFVKLLLMAIGESVSPDAENVFDDVSESDWFAPYVNTAYKLGLVTGISDTAFGIGRSITRQDMAVMIKRAADYKGISLEKKQDNTLKDMDAVSDYAKESVVALAGASVISGDENAVFNPMGTALREQAAAVICRLQSE